MFNCWRTTCNLTFFNYSNRNHKYVRMIHCTAILGTSHALGRGRITVGLTRFPEVNHYFGHTLKPQQGEIIFRAHCLAISSYEHISIFQTLLRARRDIPAH